VATSPGSTHAIILQYPLNVLISSPDQAEGFVANRVGNGSNYIKLVAESNGMTQAEHNAIVYQAHQFGQRSTTHAADYNSYAQAIASGTDSIQHSPKDKVITQDMITAILTQKIYVTPTLTVIRALTNSAINTPGDTYANAANSTTLMFQAGIPLLAGTDSADVTIPGVTTPAFGSSLHDELENLVAAGLSPVQALRAATSLPAYYHGLTDRGTIAVGKRADLLLITGDPTKNISNTRNIQRVWNAGIEFQPVA